VDRLLRYLRSLGAAGAVDNAQQLLLERQAEAFVVRRLERSLRARPAAGRQAA
jgi:hypothetical protein